MFRLLSGGAAGAGAGADSAGGAGAGSTEELFSALFSLIKPDGPDEGGEAKKMA